METLIELMRKVLADTFAMYLKAHNYHWNVEGPNFNDYHAFFATLYTELHAAVDPIAEEIRAMDAYAPGSFTRFLELTDIEDELSIPQATEMCRRLLEANTKVISTLTMAYKLAENYEQLGLANFLQDRLDIHKKHAWMLRSLTK